MDEARLLVVKNGPKRPSNGDRRRKVAFGRSEGVSGSGTFKEEAKNDQYELVGIYIVDNGRQYRARKTKTLVQIPGLWERAFTPKASNALMTTRTVVQP